MAPKTFVRASTTFSHYTYSISQTLSLTPSSLFRIHTFLVILLPPRYSIILISSLSPFISTILYVSFSSSYMRNSLSHSLYFPHPVTILYISPPLLPLRIINLATLPLLHITLLPSLLSVTPSLPQSNALSLPPSLPLCKCRHKEP